MDLNQLIPKSAHASASQIPPSVNYVKPAADADKALATTNRTMKITDPQDPVNLLKTIVSSREIVRTTANAKLAQIGEQMDFLVTQAKRVVLKCRRDEHLHQVVACNFEKKPGGMYHHYRRTSDSHEYFSLLSPAEWGDACKSEFLGTYRLELDRSFTRIDVENDEFDDETSRKYKQLADKLTY